MNENDPASIKPMWQPSADRIQQSNITKFTLHLEKSREIKLDTYQQLHDWSVAEPAEFWRQFWIFCDLQGEGELEPALVDADKMPGASWFPNLKLNFAQNLLTRVDDHPAMVFRGEDKRRQTVSYKMLNEQVAKTAAALRAEGVVAGDRVVAFLPNLPETIIAMLATASIGAIWSSSSPDFGVKGVLDRFGQVEPVILFVADGYFYNGKVHDSLAVVNEFAAELNSLRKVVVIPYVDDQPAIPSTLNKAILFPEFIDNDAVEPVFEQLPFNHPLYIMFSSGTTGIPKCIVHGAGGTLIRQVEEHRLQTNLKSEDRLFYFTTCGWMMWNWLVAGLASGSTLMLYDGSPFYPDGNVLFDFADEEKITIFGTSAKFIDAASKAGICPNKTHQLPHLHTILSTGSPLSPESYDYIYEKVKSDVCLSSVSGGTDILGCFASGSPTLPVYRGELQCLTLGMAVAVFNENGEAVAQEKGELVCTKPFPSMPVGFWNDEDGSKYFDAYFARFPNIWCHGDYVELTDRGGLIIYGRSDAVLNPGGVRIGTAEIYRQVEQLNEITEALVVGQDWQSDVRVVLFVKLQDDLTLSDELIARIKQQIRQHATPRHVPEVVLQVPDIPRTKSGKIVELAVRHIIHGREVKNSDALANPEALEFFSNRPELKA